jgi:hypothetical protein
MAKLKLSAVPDDKPVKITVELPGVVHRDLVAYADVLARQNGQEDRAHEAYRADACAVHGNGSSLFAGTTRTEGDKLIEWIYVKERPSIQSDRLIVKWRFWSQ